MNYTDHEPSWKETAFYAVAWFVCSLLLVICLLSTIEFTNTVLVRIAESITDNIKQIKFGQTKAAIIEGMYFIGGIFACGMAVWTEYYFRKGEKIGKLVPRVVKILAIEIAIVLITNVGVIVVQLV